MRKRATRAVLFDRDGTLVVDVPRNRDPARVRPMPQARDAVGRLRRAGLRVGVITNQPGIAEGWIDRSTLARLNARVEALVGPFDGWFVCTHRFEQRCSCRKPEPGLILRAAAAFGIRPCDCVMVGDIGSDVEAAVRAGARAILVPTPATRREEVRAANAVARDLTDAVAMISDGTV